MAEDILKPAINEVDLTFPSKSLENMVCTHVFHRLHEIGSAAEHFDLGSVASALGWTGPDKKKAIARALDFLSFCRSPVLDRHFALWGPQSDDVLEQPICTLSDADVRFALERNELINPASGEVVPNFADHITVEYWLTERMASILTRGDHSS